MPGYELDLDQYVRVVHFLGDTIKGRYDGVDYEFPDGSDGSFKDVHKNVAHHILGYCGTDEHKLRVVLNGLGWLNRMTYEQAVEMLSQIQYHDVPPFGPSVVSFKRPEGASPNPRVATASEGESGTVPSPASVGRSRDPLKEAKRG